MLISDFGILYRVSKRNWKRYCRAYLETEGSARLLEYGARYAGYIENNITDWKEDRYREELTWLK